MTREDAIQELQNCKGLIQQDGQDYLDERDIPLLDMAIEALSAEEAVWNEYEAEFTDLPDIPRYYYEKVVGKMAHEINMLKEQLESADAEPKWNCTANFVAEQLDRLRKMTDEEKWEFFKRFFEIKGSDSE